MAPHRLHNRKHDDVPHQPFYKDEKVLGKTITVSVSLRLLLVALVVVVVAFGYALFAVFKNNADLHNYVSRAHAARLADQARVHAEVNQLACYIIAPLKNDPQRPIIKKLRLYYHCPPYGTDPDFKLYHPAKKTSTPAKPSASSKPSGTAGSSSGVVKPKAGSVPTSTVRTTAHAAAPAPAPAPAPKPTGQGGGGVVTPTSVPVATNSAFVHVPGVSIPSIVSVPSLIGVGGTCTVHVGNVCVVA